MCQMSTEAVYFWGTLNTKLHLKTPHVAEKKPANRQGWPEKKRHRPSCPTGVSLLSAPHSRRCQRIQGVRDKTTPQVSGSQPFSAQKWIRKNVFLMIPATKKVKDQICFQDVSNMFQAGFQCGSIMLSKCFETSFTQALEISKKAVIGSARTGIMWWSKICHPPTKLYQLTLKQQGFES